MFSKNTITKTIPISNKEFWISLFFGLALLALLLLFPAENYFQTLVTFFIFLFITPWLYMRFILKKPLSVFGINWKNPRKGAAWSLILLIILSAFTYILFQYSNLLENYSLVYTVRSNFGFFLLYEMLLVNFFVFFSEFFFRGFLQSILEKRVGYWSIFIQALIFLVFLIVNHSNLFLFIPLILISLSSGIIKYKSGSILYGYLSGLLFYIVFDTLFIYFS